MSEKIDYGDFFNCEQSMSTFDYCQYLLESALKSILNGNLFSSNFYLFGFETKSKELSTNEVAILEKSHQETIKSLVAAMEKSNFLKEYLSSFEIFPIPGKIDED